MTAAPRTETFDYVVVGGGSAGCVLAARLSEDPAVRVLLLEAGGRNWMPLYRVPMLAGILRHKRYNNWWFLTEPEPHLDGRRIVWPRGRVLGGSFNMNGMVYTRGHRLDYDTWRQMGNDGWGFDDVLPYFMKSEDFRGPDSPHHGKGGPLIVSKGTGDNPLYEALLEAAGNCGHAVIDDFNHPDREGFSRHWFTIRDGRRWTTAEGFLKPAMSRPNLTVRLRSVTDRIVIEGGRAGAVKYRQNGEPRQVAAAREIVLAGGTINSPMILMHSGIGPADDLRALAIDVVADLPGVGRNLHDHIIARLQFLCSKPVGLYDELRLDRAAWHVLKALFVGGTGPGTSFPLEAGGFFRTRPELASPNIQSSFAPALGASTHLPFSKPKPGDGHGFFLSVQKAQPESRGWLKLRSANPDDPPLIQANYLAAESDRRDTRDAIRMVREIVRQKPLADYVDREIAPGPDATSDDAIDAWVRKVGDTVYHPVGSCRMGIDEQAVVDPELRVRGVAGLRVADASVMPVISSANTNAPTIMIAEKAADMLKAAAE